MVYGHFDINREVIENQYRCVVWNEDSGLSPDALKTLACQEKQRWAEQYSGFMM